VAGVIRQLLDWVEEQFRELGQPDPAGLAITLLAGYQGMSLLANALRDPDIMTREGGRLSRWLDTLARTS
jgi:TetR/AcrR family transcriptional regulator, transcriptional repressor for nem operon